MAFPLSAEMIAKLDAGMAKLKAAPAAALAPVPSPAPVPAPVLDPAASACSSAPVATAGADSKVVTSRLGEKLGESKGIARLSYFRESGLAGNSDAGTYFNDSSIFPTDDNCTISRIGYRRDPSNNYLTNIGIEYMGRTSDVVMHPANSDPPEWFVLPAGWYITEIDVFTDLNPYYAMVSGIVVFYVQLSTGTVNSSVIGVTSGQQITGVAIYGKNYNNFGWLHGIEGVGQLEALGCSFGLSGDTLTPMPIMERPRPSAAGLKAQNSSLYLPLTLSDDPMRQIVVGWSASNDSVTGIGYVLRSGVNQRWGSFGGNVYRFSIDTENEFFTEVQAEITNPGQSSAAIRWMKFSASGGRSIVMPPGQKPSNTDNINVVSGYIAGISGLFSTSVVYGLSFLVTPGKRLEYVVRSAALPSPLTAAGTTVVGQLTLNNSTATPQTLTQTLSYDTTSSTSVTYSDSFKWGVEIGVSATFFGAGVETKSTFETSKGSANTSTESKTVTVSTAFAATVPGNATITGTVVAAVAKTTGVSMLADRYQIIDYPDKDTPPGRIFLGTSYVSVTVAAAGMATANWS